MSQTGSTFGSFGSPCFNLSAAQFQVRVASAEMACLRKHKGKKGRRHCADKIRCEYYGDCTSSSRSFSSTRRSHRHHHNKRSHKHTTTDQVSVATPVAPVVTVA